MCLRQRRCRRPSSIRPVPILCLNRVTNPSRPRPRAPFPDMFVPRQRMNAYRKQPLAPTDGQQPQKRVRSATGPARSSGAGGLFLLLRAVRIWLWLRVAAGMGRVLVPNFALFVTEDRSPRHVHFARTPNSLTDMARDGARLPSVGGSTLCGAVPS
jgi:hypothetical protein